MPSFARTGPRENPMPASLEDINVQIVVFRSRDLMQKGI